MPTWSRRDLLRATAASAAVAVPTVGLRGNRAAASNKPSDADDVEAIDATTAAEVNAAGPLMVCVHDAANDDVRILHGTNEVVVKDRRLVAKIVRARTGAEPL